MQNAKLRNSIILKFKFLILNSQRAGFTLLELVLVILIISLATALIMPSFSDIGEGRLKTEARRLGGALRYVYDEAVGKKESYIFRLDLDKGLWEFEGSKEKRGAELKGDVEIADVITPSLGKISKGEVFIEFGPLGPAEQITLHLRKNKSEYSVIFNHLNGRTKTLEGYAL
ncbi:MAG: prepilin-type N-terminal cleavage/methylation domain-containing protein [Nitrospirae bacterium]|nr:prepilin-type N-terminal cleavage/methylation domain-containing protein [Nitrospirota bacterium]